MESGARAFELARTELERKQALHEQGTVSDEALEQAQRGFSEAEVNYQQSLLAVIFEQQYVAVDSAVKYQSPDGRKRVRVTLKNLSGGGAEFKKLLGVDDPLLRVGSQLPGITNDEDGADGLALASLHGQLGGKNQDSLQDTGCDIL